MEQQDLRLGGYLKTLWKGKWLILLTTVISLGGVVAFANNQPESSYRAVATIKVEPVGTPAAANLTGQLSLDDRNLNTYVLLLQSRNVMERVLRNLPIPEEERESGVIALQVEELRSAIGVRAIPNANLLEVTARGQTPQIAEGLANAVIGAFIEYVKEERTRVTEEALVDLNAQITAASAQEGVDDLILIMIPDLDSELNGIAQSVEQSHHTLEELRPQGNSDDPMSALGVDVPRLENSAASLERVSQGLQEIQVKLEEGHELTPVTGATSLEQEASRMRATITNLDQTYNDLREIRSQVNRSGPVQRDQDLAVRADEARSTLRLASQQLDQVRAESIEQSRRIFSVREYIESVASELQKLNTRVGVSPNGTPELQENQRIALRGQLSAYTVGLRTASEDLGDMRANLDLSEYGKIVTARGYLETADTQLKGLVAQLERSSSNATVYDSLQEIMDWTEQAKKDLQAVIANFLGSQVVEGTEAERDAAYRASNDMGNVSLTLEVGAARLRNLSPRVTDPLLQVRINGASSRLATAQRSTTESATRLQTIAQVEGSTMAERIEAIRNRVQDGATDLLMIAETMSVNDPTFDGAANLARANEAYSDISRVVWSLDAASRQLQGVLRSSSDPLFQGEVASLENRLASAQREVVTVSDRLAYVSSGGSAGGGIYGQLALAENKLEVAATSLRSAVGTYGEESNNEDGISAADVANIKESVDIAAAILGRVGEELAGLQAAEIDSLRFGQLVVAVGRIRDARLRSEEISSQLRSLQGNTPPEVREMRQLRRQLELSLLQPQETGITQVDSAVSPQASGRRSIFSQAMVPLAAVAGLLLGSLGVLFKAQVDPTVRSHTQLRDRFDLMSLGVIPKGKPRGNPHPPMVSIGDQPVFSEALQLVGAGLSRPIGGGVRSFLITSAGPKEGKTMLAVNLAYVLAHNGHRVLLVDGNLRKPEVANVLDLPQGEGLATALAQQQSPLDYVVETGGFDVLPGGSPPYNPVELLSSAAMPFFLKQAQRSYDVVLVDGPPTLGFAEFKSQDQGVNASILVVRAGVTKIEAVEAAKSELEAVGIPVLATVLNFAPGDECHHLRHEKYTAGYKRAKFWPW